MNKVLKIYKGTDNKLYAKVKREMASCNGCDILEMKKRKHHTCCDDIKKKLFRNRQVVCYANCIIVNITDGI